MKTKTKIYVKEKIFVLLFAALLLLPFPLFLVCKSYVDTENFENRTPAAFPNVFQSGIKAFPTLFDAYLNDHAPFRNQFMKLYGSTNLKLFSMVDHDNVILGTDGWLFYNEYTEQNDAINVADYFSVMDYQGMIQLSPNRLEQGAKALTQLKEVLAKTDKKLVVFVAPNKESIYSEFMPEFYPKVGMQTMADQMVDYLRQNTNVPVVFPKQQLLANKAEAQLYYKYDTHWNEAGAFVGVQEINKALGLSAYTLDEIN
ncbi:MAG: hypothetical protein PHG02_10270, partial [Oscillospiraceae bacterium]|nr:hypothetical protein [Oscillospiraceae bacterium]